MTLPSTTVSPRAAAASMAVVRGARTFREVGRAIGSTSMSTVQRALREAEEYGLIAYEHATSRNNGPRSGGTLRPLVQVVANTPR